MKEIRLRELNLEQLEFESDEVILLLNSQEYYDEFIIEDNIEFFRELYKKGKKIKVKYEEGEKIFSLEQILESEKFLETITEEIKSKNFTPLEQLVAAYDMTKFLKEYKEESQNMKEDTSRALYEYLSNEYMVCVGYANFLVNLCRRLGIQCSEFSVMVKYEDKPEKHSKNLVNLIDDKYQINGYYYLDATYDSKKDFDQNVFSIDEESTRSRYDYFLNSTSVTGSQHMTVIDDKDDSYFLRIDNLEKFKEYIQNSVKRENMLKQIKVLDREFYEQIYQLDFSQEENLKIVMNYLKKKTEPEIPKEKLINAIMEIKKSIYKNLNDDDFERMRNSYELSTAFLKKSFSENDEEIYSKYLNSISHNFMKKELLDIRLELEGSKLIELFQNFIKVKVNTFLKEKKMQDVYWEGKNFCIKIQEKDLDNIIKHLDIFNVMKWNVDKLTPKEEISYTCDCIQLDCLQGEIIKLMYLYRAVVCGKGQEIRNKILKNLDPNFLEKNYSEFSEDDMNYFCLAQNFINEEIKKIFHHTDVFILGEKCYVDVDEYASCLNNAGKDILKNEGFQFCMRDKKKYIAIPINEQVSMAKILEDVTKKQEILYEVFQIEKPNEEDIEL